MKRYEWYHHPVPKAEYRIIDNDEGEVICECYTKEFAEKVTDLLEQAEISKPAMTEKVE